MQKNIITQIFTKIKDYLKNKVENKSKKLTIYDLDLKVGDEVNTEDYSFRVLEKYVRQDKNNPSSFTTYCDIIILKVYDPDLSIIEGEEYTLTLLGINTWSDTISYFFNSNKSLEYNSYQYFSYNPSASIQITRDFDTDWKNE